MHRTLRFLIWLTLILVIALGGCHHGAPTSDCESSAGNNDDCDATWAGATKVAMFRACGGDPEGAWIVRSISFSRGLNIAALDDPACKDAIQSAEVRAAGMAVFKAGVANLDAVTMRLTDVELDEACVSALAVAPARPSVALCDAIGRELGMEEAFAVTQCSLGDEVCDCSLADSPQPLRSKGAYSVHGKELQLADGPSRPFCVHDQTLELQIPGPMGSSLLVLSKAAVADDAAADTP